MNLVRVENATFSSNEKCLITYDGYFHDNQTLLLKEELKKVASVVYLLQLKQIPVYCLPVLDEDQSPSFPKETIASLMQDITGKEFPIYFLESKDMPKSDAKGVFFLKPDSGYDGFSSIIIQSYRFLKQLKLQNQSGSKKNLKFYITADVDETLHFLQNLQNNTLKNKLGILGGNQIQKTNHFVERFVRYFQYLLFGGSVGLHILKANGVNIGNSPYDKEELSMSFQALHRASYEECIVELPYDHIVTEQIGSKMKTKTSQREIPSPYVAIDIGGKTLQVFEERMKLASLILMHGPVGMVELEKARKGTLEILKILSKLKKPVLVSGYELCSFALRENISLRLVPDFDFITSFLDK